MYRVIVALVLSLLIHWGRLFPVIKQNIVSHLSTVPESPRGEGVTLGGWRQVVKGQEWVS